MITLTDKKDIKIPNLSKRMFAVADMVTKGNSVCDVGCDHGYVSIYLYLTGMAHFCIAADIRKGPLETAKANIAFYGADDGVKTRLGSGLSVIKPFEAETIIIAGMGGNTIISILKESIDTALSVKEIILEPQSEIANLRKYLYFEGFVIEREDMVSEEGKYYPIIKAVHTGKKEILSDEELAFGPYLLKSKNAVLKEYLLKRKSWLLKMSAELCNNKSPKALKRYEELRDEMKILSKGLEYYD